MKTFGAMAVMTLAVTGCSKKDEAKEQAAAATSAATVTGAPPATAVAALAGAAKGGCSLITEKEATEALGQPSKYRSNDPGSKNCVVDPVAEQTPKTPGTSVDFEPRKANAAGWAMSAKGGDAVADLGDKAVWIKDMHQLHVVKGDRELTMTLSNPYAPKEDLKPKAVAFAKKVISRAF